MNKSMSCSRFVKDRAGYLERKNALRGFFDGEKAFPSDCVKIKCRFRIVFHAHSQLAMGSIGQVPGMRPGLFDLRLRAGADVATPGHDAIPDTGSGPGAAGQLP